MAHLTKLAFRPTYGTYGSLVWREPKKDNIFTNRWKLLPSLRNNIFYVDNIYAEIQSSYVFNYEDINHNNIYNAKSASLEIEASDNIEVLLSKLDIVLNVGANDAYAYASFINTETPLFRIIKSYKLTRSFCSHIT